jgi:hypothetical protein
MNYLEELKNKPSTKDIQREIVRVNVGMEDVDDNKPSKNVNLKTPANIPMITEEIDVNYDRNALKK